MEQLLVSSFAGRLHLLRGGGGAPLEVPILEHYAGFNEFLKGNVSEHSEEDKRCPAD